MGMSRLDNQDFHIATEHKYPNGMGNKENHVLEVGLRCVSVYGIA